VVSKIEHVQIIQNNPPCVYEQDKHVNKVSAFKNANITGSFHA